MLLKRCGRLRRAERFEPHMAKRTGKTENTATAMRDRARLERKVAELKTELEKLPANRQAELLRKLEERGGQ